MSKASKPPVWQFLEHGFGPVFDRNSRVLILGSFPSVKSREQQFYYGHRQNRFWPLLAELLHEPLPTTVPEKRAMVLRHGIALWDTVESCRICGSSDSSIRDVVPTNLQQILDVAEIQAIFTNGATSARVFHKYQEPVIHRTAVTLPSTSPANAAWSLARLIEAWDVVTQYLYTRRQNDLPQ